MKSIIRRTAAGLAAAVMTVSIAAANTVLAGADGIDIRNALFETDIWAEGSGWTVDIDWDTGATANYVSYADKGADAPSTGSANGVNVWFPSDSTGGTAVISQDVYVPAGEFIVRAQGMGENCDLRVALDSNESGNCGMTGWNNWNEAQISVDNAAAGTQKLHIIAECQPGGWIYLDGVTVEVIRMDEPADSTSSEDSSSQTDSSKPDDSSGTADSSSTSSQNNAAQHNTIYNGNFEKVSETDLVGWTVAWNDDLKCWYAADEQKAGRANLANNYLNVWASKAVPFSLKQTVHFTPGDYKIAYSLDANENFDTGVKVRVGSLVTSALPKGQGWEKWTACTSDRFTVSEEGDYEVEFFGDLAADAWFCLDNIEVKDGSYDPSSGTTSSTGSTSSTRSTTTTTTSTAAASSAGTDSTANTETGAYDTAAKALLFATTAAAVIVVSKKRRD